MIYKFRNKAIVFTKEVINQLNKYKQHDLEQHEAGGILLGKIYDEAIIIDEISEPSTKDRAGRHFFERNVVRAQRIVEQTWKESNGERIYLGEWHTHPEKNPLPSKDDIKLAKNMLDHSKMEIDYLFMMIIGLETPYVGVLQKDKPELNCFEKIDGLKIKIFLDQNEKVYGFQAAGYLGIAKKGFDIYDSGFSVTFYGAINSIFKLTSVKEFILEEASGFIRFIIPEMNDDKISLIFASMQIQISLMIESMREKDLNEKVTLEYKKITI